VCWSGGGAVVLLRQQDECAVLGFAEVWVLMLDGAAGHAHRPLVVPQELADEVCGVAD